MWTNLSIGAFRFRRVQIEEHRTGGGKMWTNLVHRTLPGSTWSAVGDRPSPARFTANWLAYLISYPIATSLSDLDSLLIAYQ